MMKKVNEHLFQAPISTAMIFVAHSETYICQWQKKREQISFVLSAYARLDVNELYMLFWMVSHLFWLNANESRDKKSFFPGKEIIL